MRILYIYPTLAIWGGIERVLVDKMNELSSRYGWDIFILTYNQGNHPVPYRLNDKVRHVDLGVRTHVIYQYKGLRRLWEICKRQCMLYRKMKTCVDEIIPDVIVTANTDILYLLLKVSNNVPLVVESHVGMENQFDVTKMSIGHRYAVYARRHLLNKVDAIISLTDAEANKWRAHYSHVHVIPNIVHLNETGEYSSCMEKRVIFVGRFAYQKGLPDLLAVWQLVRQRHPDWQLDMYGEGEDKQWLLNEITTQNTNIVVHQPVSNIHRCYINSSIFVITSLYEPFGLVIPEAMSCGLPVVSFESDGPNSIITDGENGFIVKNRSVSDFADRVCQLIEDRELRTRMGQNAIKSSQRYSADNIMPIWKAFFESV